MCITADQLTCTLGHSLSLFATMSYPSRVSIQIRGNAIVLSRANNMTCFNKGIYVVHYFLTEKCVRYRQLLTNHNDIVPILNIAITQYRWISGNDCNNNNCDVLWMFDYTVCWYTLARYCKIWRYIVTNYQKPQSTVYFRNTKKRCVLSPMALSNHICELIHRHKKLDQCVSLNFFIMDPDRFSNHPL